MLQNQSEYEEKGLIQAIYWLCKLIMVVCRLMQAHPRVAKFAVSCFILALPVMAMKSPIRFSVSGFIAGIFERKMSKESAAYLSAGDYLHEFSNMTGSLEADVKAYHFYKKSLDLNPSKEQRVYALGGMAVVSAHQAEPHRCRFHLEKILETRPSNDWARLALNSNKCNDLFWKR